MKKHAWAVGFGTCLTAFTLFLSLDTFVLSSVYQTNATQMNTAMFQQVDEDASEAEPEKAEAVAKVETGASTDTQKSETVSDVKTGASTDAEKSETVSDVKTGASTDAEKSETVSDVKTGTSTDAEKAETVPDAETGASTDAKKSEAFTEKGNNPSGDGEKTQKQPEDSKKTADRPSGTGGENGKSGRDGRKPGRPSGKKFGSGGESSFRSSGGSPSVSGSGNVRSEKTGSGNAGSGNAVNGNAGSGNAVNGNAGNGNAGSGNAVNGNAGNGNAGNGRAGKEQAGPSKSRSSFNEEEAAKEAAAVTTDNSGSSDTYQDENVTIRYTEYTTNGTTIHVADVQLKSAQYLKTAFAEDTYGKNVVQSTSEIAAAHDALLAINGDYYGVQEKGYVIRNGIVYRDEAGKNDVLCIYADGTMKVVDPSSATAQELVEQGVWQAFSFGPGLLEDGEIAVSLDSEVGRAKASNPRTAIGMIDDLHYVFVVSDGRSDESEGLSLYELAVFMEQLGVKTAYNLDGGGSSTMYFKGEVVNEPAGGFGDREREVSDIVYIG